MPSTVAQGGRRWVGGWEIWVRRTGNLYIEQLFTVTPESREQTGTCSFNFPHAPWNSVAAPQEWLLFESEICFTEPVPQAPECRGRSQAERVGLPGNSTLTLCLFRKEVWW